MPETILNQERKAAEAQAIPGTDTLHDNAKAVLFVCSAMSAYFPRGSTPPLLHPVPGNQAN